MRIYLAASLNSSSLPDSAFEGKPFCLQSFYDSNDFSIERMKFCSDVLIDSGAFSLRKQEAKDENVYEEYLEKYCAFINKYDIKHFFELDIDNVVGYEKVKYFRKRIEQLTGKQPIVVWQINRGIEEFTRHCEEYPYVALGGYAGSNGAKQSAYRRAYSYFIDTAHKHNAKIHGLGFTALQSLNRYHFDSVDSTTWLNGSKYGILYKFNGRTLKTFGAPEKKRVNGGKAAEYNFKEWVKFQKYAEGHL